MPVFDSSSIASVAIHRVGNKATDEGCILSGKEQQLTEVLQDLLIRYFLTPFKAEEYYNLFHEENLILNPVYQSVTRLFDDPATLLDQSQQLVRLLYDVSMHPNIKGGEFFVVYFKECQLNGVTMDAVGLFKAENKSQFLKVLHDDEEWSSANNSREASARFRMDVDKGIDISKLEKGALIFNTERDQGSVDSVVDASGRGTDALYWKDSFLSVRQRQDSFFNTHQVMQAYKRFVTEELPQQYEDVSRADQADLLNRSVNFFKQNDHFDMDDFARDVI